jgi:hypothetical protein
VIAGFLVTLVLGFGAGPYVRWASKSSTALPDGASEKHKLQWKELTSGGEGGAFIGWLERFMFFAAFLTDSALLAIGAWLTFKVASKWNAWTNITAVPRELEGVSDLDAAIGRRRWASNILTTFLVGTAYNICAGIVGAAVARNFGQLSKLIGY